MERYPGPELRLTAAETLGGERIIDRHGEDLGTIDDLMIDVAEGTIEFAVVATDDLRGARRLTIPWKSLTRDNERRCFVLETET
jgi:sporulation protein YlmC with PRC-barrel domain